MKCRVSRSPWHLRHLGGALWEAVLLLPLLQLCMLGCSNLMKNRKKSQSELHVSILRSSQQKGGLPDLRWTKVTIEVKRDTTGCSSTRTKHNEQTNQSKSLFQRVEKQHKADLLSLWFCWWMSLAPQKLNSSQVFGKCGRSHQVVSEMLPILFVQDVRNVQRELQTHCLIWPLLD